MRLASPTLLLALGLLPLLLYLLRRRNRDVAVQFPTLGPLRAAAPVSASRRRAVLTLLRLGTLGLLVFALARPQAGTAESQIHREGVDVVVAFDVSGSMLAEDFQLDGQRVPLGMDQQLAVEFLEVPSFVRHGSALQQGGKARDLDEVVHDGEATTARVAWRNRAVRDSMPV